MIDFSTFITTIIPLLSGGAGTFLILFLIHGKNLFRLKKTEGLSKEVDDIASMQKSARDALIETTNEMLAIHKQYQSAASDSIQKSGLLRQYKSLVEKHFSQCNFEDKDLSLHNKIVKDILDKEDGIYESN